MELTSEELNSIEIKQCKFVVSWVGKCKHSTLTEYCDKHRLKCSSCGEDATHDCEETMGLVCGAPLCDKCEHSTYSNGCNSGGTLPEGMTGHVRKDKQVYKPWYSRKNELDIFINSPEKP